MEAVINGIPVSHITKKALHCDPRWDTPIKRVTMIGIAVRDGMHCTYCKKPLKFAWMGEVEKNIQATFEHYWLPASRGGKISMRNGKIACQKCNSHRSTQLVFWFRWRMKKGYYTNEARRDRRKVKKLIKKHRRRMGRDVEYAYINRSRLQIIVDFFTY